MIYAGVYVPPLTKAWTRREHERLLEDTLNELERTVSQENDVIVLGDFNSKGTYWEEGTCTGGENSWSNRLMNWAEENLMTQWIDCETRASGKDNPSRLDLLFTKDNEIIKTIRYEYPLGKSDHILIDINLNTKIAKVEEGYKMERYRYNKTNFEEIRRYFENVSWRNFEEEEDMQEKWNRFIEIYSMILQSRSMYRRGE